MASRKLGGNSIILNAHDNLTSRQRAEIAKHEAEFTGWLTAIRQHEADLGYVELSDENRRVITGLATDQGMTIEGYALHLQKLDDARFSAVSQLLTRELDRVYGAMIGGQTLAYKREEAAIEVEKTRQLGEAEVDKDRQREHVKLTGEAESTIQTLKVGDEANRAAFRSRMDTIDQCGEVEAKIWALKREPGMDEELRASQLRRLERQLALLEAQLEPPKGADGAAQ